MAQAEPESNEAFRFYIESGAPFQERRPRSLKQGHTFAVFNPRGDIVAADGSRDGVYHRDTRFLSRLELRLNDSPLLLLSSNVQEDNTVLSVDLTNPDLSAAGQIVLRGELIHVNRRKYIWQNCCYERVLVNNFDVVAHDLTLSIALPRRFRRSVRGARAKAAAARPVVGRTALEQRRWRCTIWGWTGSSGSPA